MPLIILGVVILLIALLAPVIWGALVWVFSNMITTAIILIIVGVVFVIVKTIVKFVFFETDENTGDYLMDEFNNKIRKDWKGVLEGVLLASLAISIAVYFTHSWLTT